MIKNPNEIVETLVDDLQTAFGTRMLGMCLYGPAVSHEYIPGKSPVNLLVILSDTSISTLHKGSAAIGKWLRRGIAPPLFLTPVDIPIYAKDFPVEILSIKQLYRVVAGGDYLAVMPLRKDNLHRQCMRELYGIALHLRRTYVAAKNPGRLETVMKTALQTLLPVFKALLIIFDKKIPHSRTEIIAAAEDLFGMGSSILSKIHNCKRFNKKDVHSWYDQLAITVDSMIAETAARNAAAQKETRSAEADRVPSL